ncbi:MAG: very short patch repair endonuclease [Acetatifactor sp.]|uniref:Very short patch repair endonuclease n=1 Tax=Anaerobutyricum soehngenii TaxID=105843 RepID=A0A6N7YER1_9FIRM|nr:very short patch repair endonuclease [Anaerobutyricum soehngenii]MSU82175.1 DNA mismatch endonuclease Vsr [Anaerobutyricum soehngenii]
MDVHDQKTRSYNMSRVKGKDTKPEEIVRKYLFSQGFRYRKNDKRLPGKPDIVLPKYKTVIFVNGCFWHKHEGCKYFVWPKSNSEFWKEKIESNIVRDKKQYEELKNAGWHVIIVWECELKKKQRMDTLERLVTEIQTIVETQ